MDMTKKKYEIQMVHSDGRDEEMTALGQTFNISQDVRVLDLTDDQVNELRATNRFMISPFAPPKKTKAKKGKQSPPQEDNE